MTCRSNAALCVASCGKNTGLDGRIWVYFISFQYIVLCTDLPCYMLNKRLLLHSLQLHCFWWSVGCARNCADTTSHTQSGWSCMLIVGICSPIHDMYSECILDNTSYQADGLPSCRRCSWVAAVFHSEPNMRRDTFGDRAFSAAGPGLWNSLPSHLKDADLSYNEFRRSLRHFCLDSGATAQCELLGPINCAD